MRTNKDLQVSYLGTQRIVDTISPVNNSLNFVTVLLLIVSWYKLRRDFLISSRKFLKDGCRLTSFKNNSNSSRKVLPLMSKGKSKKIQDSIKTPSSKVGSFKKVFLNRANILSKLEICFPQLRRTQKIATIWNRQDFNLIRFVYHWFFPYFCVHLVLFIACGFLIF